MADNEFMTGRGIPIPTEHVMLIEKTPFIKFPGIVRLAHLTAEKEGGKLTQISHRVDSYPSKENDFTCSIVVCFGVLKDGEITEQFFGTGDASPQSVGKRIVPHVIRMAETRAIARALRVFTDVGMTALEELDDIKNAYTDDNPVQTTTKRDYNPKPRPEKNFTEMQLALKERIANYKLVPQDIKDLASSLLGIEIKTPKTLTDEQIKIIVDKIDAENKKEEALPEATPEAETKPESALTDRTAIYARLNAWKSERNLTTEDIRQQAAKFFGRDAVVMKDLTIDELNQFAAWLLK